MRDVELRGKTYQACSEWEDLTLEQFIALSKIQIPEKLERLWAASSLLNTDDPKEKKQAEQEYKAANDDILEKDLIKVFPTYYGKVIEHLTTIPKGIVNLMHHDIRVDMFDETLRGFVLSLVYSAPVITTNGETELYEPKEIESFKMGKEEFFFPKSLRLFGDVIPMADEEVAPFAEAADIDLAIRELRRDGVERFPLFMSIYCRKDGEEYEERLALERAEQFKKAKMHIVWALFFCIVQLTRTSHSSIRKSLQLIHRQIGDRTSAPAG